MHLLIVFTGEFKTKVFPLGGKFQLDQAIALKKLGIKTGILAPGLLSIRRMFNKYPYKKFQKYKKVPVLRDYKQNLLPARINIYNLWLAYRYKKFGLKLFEKYIIKHGIPDLIHCFDLRFGAFVANEINKKYNVPYITTEFSSETAENTFPMCLKHSIMPILKNAKLVTAASIPFAKKFKKKLNLKNINVSPFYPLLSPDVVKDKITNLKLSSKKFTFLTVNRLDKNKNIKFMLIAFSKKFRKKKVELKIVGDGPELNKLKKLALELNIYKQVIFVHRASRNKLKKEMKNADCFLSSSYVETFGAVLAEAIAYGLPVISTKSEGATEIINKSNGILIKHGAVKAYANSMLKIYLKKFKYNKFKIREDIIKRFGFERYSKNAKKIYSNAIK